MIDAISTIGDEIKKENVTPKGKPAVVKPIKIGILEQLQNGVTVPISAPNRFLSILAFLLTTPSCVRVEIRLYDTHTEYKYRKKYKYFNGIKNKKL
jgi:hypothetical protein